MTGGRVTWVYEDFYLQMCTFAFIGSCAIVQMIVKLDLVKMASDEESGSVEDFSITQAARPGSKSVRATIPEIVAEQARIGPNTRLRWKYDKKTDEIRVTKA